MRNVVSRIKIKHVSKLTESEILFQRICERKYIHWRRIQETNVEKRPDYFVLIKNQLIVVEVKQFDLNKREKEIWGELNKGKVTSYFNPAKYRIREKIESGRKQLKKFSKRPTLLLLFDNTGGLLGVESDDILQAMHGNETYKYLVPNQPDIPPILANRFLGGGQKLTGKRSTYISGIARMFKPNFENNYQIHIFHNRFTDNPLDPSIASNIADQQFELERTNIDNFYKWEKIKV